MSFSRFLSALSRRLGDSTGQVMISFMLMSGIVGFVGVLTLDVGFWLAERREAQGDADAIAMAGAFELPVFDADLPSGQQSEAAGFAIAAAEDWARANNVWLGSSDSYTDPDSELALEVVWNDRCFPGSTPGQTYVGVRATVTRNSPSFFLKLLRSVGDIDQLTRVSVSATACTGVAVEAFGFSPWVLSMSGDCFDAISGEPLYGRRCVLVDGAESGGSANLGQISIDPDGIACPADGNNSAPEYQENIANGVNIGCAVGNALSSNPGLSPLATLNGIKDRLAAYGGSEPCDAAFNGDQAVLNAGDAAFNVAGFIQLPQQIVSDGIDDFFENWKLAPGYDPLEPAVNLELVDCSADEGVQSGPRNMAIFLVADLGTSDSNECSNSGNVCYEILGVAAVYLEGCSSDGGVTVEDDFDCDPPYGLLQIYGRLASSISYSPLNLGFQSFGDWQTFLKE